MAFSFTAPPPPFGGGVTGETRGRLIFGDGILHWDGPTALPFGIGGLLGIKLFDTDFDLANNGVPQFANVKAEFSLLLAPTEQEAPRNAASPVRCGYSVQSLRVVQALGAGARSGRRNSPPPPDRFLG